MTLLEEVDKDLVAAMKAREEAERPPHDEDRVEVEANGVWPAISRC
jgi:hypothetical protein